MAPDLSDYVATDTEQTWKRTLNFNYGKLPKSKIRQFERVVAPHIDSFDWFLETGLPGLAEAIAPLKFQFNKDDPSTRYKLEIESISVEPPTLNDSEPGHTREVYPQECRARKINYEGQAQIKFIMSDLATGTSQEATKTFDIPLMVGSSKCHLRGKSPKQLVKLNEDHFELGGYFVCGGNEKVIRLLNMNKRNHPMGLYRSGFAKRRAHYQTAGIMIRCIDKWERCANVNVHINKYEELETVFYINKRLVHLPLMIVIRGLCALNDLEVYNEFAQTMREEENYIAAVKMMLNDLTNTHKMRNQNDALKYIGAQFRVLGQCPLWYTDVQIGIYYLDNYCLIHLNDNIDKVRLYALMARKLFRLSLKRSMVDNPDSPENHEALLPGHLFQSFTREIVESSMELIKGLMIKDYRYRAAQGDDEIGANALGFACGKMGDIGRDLNYLIATGNLRSKSGLGLQQMAGLVVTAEKINFARFYCHFRTIHRGAFFMEMKTTTPRKLATAAWGFICPVNTPDGPPCGLMNHLAHTVAINMRTYNTEKLLELLPSLGAKGLGTFANEADTPICLNGRLVGWIEASRGRKFELELRRAKIAGEIPTTLEIVHAPKPLNRDEAVLNPGIYLFTDPARFMRPVWNLNENAIETIGCMEQVWLNICIDQSERNELTEYQELSPNVILSELACMTPFSQMNAGARNIYQCQMAKQTFGVPSHTLTHRSDNKMYKLQTPQEPICRAKVHDAWSIDDLPLGTNLMVACISYTGYDMEDACIINKMGKERGLMYGTIYKTKIIDMGEVEHQKQKASCTLGCVDPEDPSDVALYRKKAGKLALDGLPAAGSRIVSGDPIYCYYDHEAAAYVVEYYSSTDEEVFVESVRIFTQNYQNKKSRRQSGTGIRTAAIMYRVPRPMTIGDKMASRHGQKGICSRLWATTDLPWTESGMVPDLIFNPHGFPSRMTVGMMVELLANKAGIVNGRVYDSTPFLFDEEHPADRHYGEVLKEAGMNYYGVERMYSGTSGQELEAEIFFGPIYYQRLRHMVSDKFQARAAAGPNDPVTSQPVKGRARGGGVRMGEMERDGIISHGCTAIARDRLFQCSDYAAVNLCSRCGNLLAPTVTPSYKSSKWDKTTSNVVAECGLCGPKAKIVKTDMPYVMIYLAAELACMNVKMEFKFNESDTRRDYQIKETERK